MTADCRVSVADIPRCVESVESCSRQIIESNGYVKCSLICIVIIGVVYILDVIMY